jgi:hypothetical protein
MATVEVRPPEGQTWSEAARAHVFYDDIPILNIPLFKARWTKAELSIHQHKFGRGVVIVYTGDLPTGGSPIKLPLETKSKGQYDVIFKIKQSEPIGMVYLYEETIEEAKEIWEKTNA